MIYCLYRIAILDEAIHISQHRPKACIIFQRQGQALAQLNHAAGDRDWTQEVARIKKEGKMVAHCVDVSYFFIPIYYIYSFNFDENLRFMTT